MNRLIEFIAAPIRDAADEQREFLRRGKDKSGRYGALVVLVASAFFLAGRSYGTREVACDAVMQYVLVSLSGDVFSNWRETLTDPLNEQIIFLVYWSLSQFVFYVVGPVLIIRLCLQRPVREYGTKLRGMFRCWWVYLLMYLVMAPFIYIASTLDGFQETYPFYRTAPDESLWPRFYIWQAFYMLQFASLEFFFRGFMVHGTKRQLGPYCILVMMIPYCMIHFQKPMSEAIGAIFAGMILGLMSLKTRSIWMGAMLHMLVALSMDFAALCR